VRRDQKRWAQSLNWRSLDVLPFFNPIDGADASVDPIDHTQV
jgi:hypothetical protein